MWGVRVKNNEEGHKILHDHKVPHHRPIVSDNYDIIDGEYIGKEEIVFPTDDPRAVEEALKSSEVEYKIVKRGWFSWR